MTSRGDKQPPRKWWLENACRIAAFRLRKQRYISANTCWTTVRPELDGEIESSVRLAGSILDKLVAQHLGFFAHTKQPWYQPNDADVPK